MRLVGTVTDWLTAGGGVGAFAATTVLAVVAFKQMATLTDQAQATRDQVEVMRRAAADDAALVRDQINAAREQVEVMRAVAADEATAMKDQIRASIEQSDAIRDAARVLIQPRVLAHAIGASTRGPDAFLDLGEGEVGFTYRLTNEGGGIALNIRHGIELAGADYEFGDGMETRALGAGQSMPPLDSELGGFGPLMVAKREDDLPAGWESLSRRYWARFDNALGERYETRNPIDPQEPATFERVPSETR